MKKGFTLIEIMVAVVIVLVATFSVLNLSSNSKHLFEIVEKNSLFSLKASIVANEQNSSNLYENLIDFNITNDEIIHSLKKEKLNILIQSHTEKFENLELETKKMKIYNKTNQLNLYEVNIK